MKKITSIIVAITMFLVSITASFAEFSITCEADLRNAMTVHFDQQELTYLGEQGTFKQTSFRVNNPKAKGTADYILYMRLMGKPEKQVIAELKKLNIPGYMIVNDTANKKYVIGVLEEAMELYVQSEIYFDYKTKKMVGFCLEDYYPYIDDKSLDTNLGEWMMLMDIFTNKAPAEKVTRFHDNTDGLEQWFCETPAGNKTWCSSSFYILYNQDDYNLIDSYANHFKYFIDELNFVKYSVFDN